MKHQQNKAKTTNTSTNSNGFFPNSIKFISSCVRTVSSGVRSAGASVASSINSESAEDRKDQVLWASFDRLELGPFAFKNVLLLGYTNGFQVLDADDASSVSELVSKRDDPCTFMQIQPIPEKTEDVEGFRAAHPLLIIVAGDEIKGSESMLRRRDGAVRDDFTEPAMGSFGSSPTAVRFYSMRSHNYVHVLRFRSAVYTVRCSPRIIAVGLASQVYCFDALTLENKFSVLTYPVPQSGVQGSSTINVGYGPMDVGPRWLAYASNNPLLTNTGRLSPQSLTPSPGVSPSTSPGSGALVARYAVESSKHLAAGIINLGDMGYKTLSKYYQELLPDGPSSPVSSNSGWKVGRSAAHSSETENAGMVVIKDFVSRAVVSQFRAHSSPISALCFDPSGTLLVTASIHGNNINIFRIMPSCSQNGSGSQSYNWASAHVHLYKLHRGITSAVIQDICFSHYSQWVAIVSCKGTCHVYVLSPFGGESGLQVQNHHIDGPILTPMLSLPWWPGSSSLGTKNQNTFPAPAPPPVTVSVVSRIRTGNSGWLNTVSNAASSAAGISSMTSGAISAVFHCLTSSACIRNGSKAKALEHLLVYSPPGHLIQYELLPYIGTEANEAVSGSVFHMQGEELRVKSEPVQWWDVCRRVDWPEREECITGITFDQKCNPGFGVDLSDTEENGASGKGLAKAQERSHWYLSNAEVQMSYARLPAWQNSKIYFYALDVTPNGLNISEESSGGEIEIEKILVHEIEIKRKDLLPVFDHSQRTHSGWSGRMYGLGRSASPSETYVPEGKFPGDEFFPVKPDSSKVTPRQEYGSSLLMSGLCNMKHHDMVNYPPILQTLVEKQAERNSSISAPTLLTPTSLKNQYAAGSSTDSSAHASPLGKARLVNSCPAENYIPDGARPSPDSVGSSGASNVSSNRSDFSMNLVDEGPPEESDQDPVNFGKFFQEEYCKASLPLADESRDTGETVPDVDGGGSPCNKGIPEEEEENDQMLGGVFAFSE